MTIFGKKIKLRSAKESDRKNIFLWLTQSDITPSVMGIPNYPEHPICTWKEFCNDYKPHFFNSSGNGKGRNYIIVVKDEAVGAIGYDLLDKKKKRVVLDIWMRSEKYCGLGYGIDALGCLCIYLNKKFEINNFIISPSARNKRAIHAYQKCGFKYVSTMDKEEQKKVFGISEYDDNILMVKRIPNV